MTRRKLLQTAMLGTPAALLADRPQADRPFAQTRQVKITKVEVLHLEKPLKERFWMANSPIGGFQPKASRLIVTLHTDAGISGHGEGSGGGADLFRRGFAAANVVSAMAPIDAAIYDIMAKSAGLPVYKFLGGYRDTVPAYVTGGYYREGKGIPELVQEVRGYVDQGFNALKLKVGGVSGGYSVEDD